MHLSSFHSGNDDFANDIFFQVKWLERFMSAMLCVGGGVLLATVFVHMIPEVRESLENARKLGYLGSSKPDEHGHDHGYPFAELVVCAGFFVIYLIEAMVNRFFGLDQGQHHHHGHGAPVQTTQQPQNALQAENGGMDNPGFQDITLNSPPDTPNTTANTTGVNYNPDKKICSPSTTEDNHPDTAVSAFSPFGFNKYK
jgi:hypothetical protein